MLLVAFDKMNHGLISINLCTLEVVSTKNKGKVARLARYIEIFVENVRDLCTGYDLFKDGII